MANGGQPKLGGTRRAAAMVGLFAGTSVSAHAGPAPEVAGYGSWASPLSAEVLSGGRVSYGNLRSVEGRLYWTETEPAAGGAFALFSMGADEVGSRVSPQGANVRTRVHEYGGAPYVVVGESVYYSQFSDQRVYVLESGAAAKPLTPAGYRYADCTAAPAVGRSGNALICVREDHTDPARVRNALVRVPLPAGGAGDVLYDGSDFVAYPRPSPDGRRLAFISWNHPHMPWDATSLVVAKLTEHGLEAPVTVAGGASESVLEPQWDSDGTLYFISDRSGFWNMYALRAGRVHAVWPRAAECAGPLWQFGQANYALLGDGRAVLRFGERGLDRLAVVDLKRGTGHVLDLPYVEYGELTRVDAGHVAAVAHSAEAPPAIVRIDVANGSARTLHGTGPALLAPSAVSVATPIDFPSAHGRIAHAFYYPPVNPGFRAPPNSLPPLLTFVHGGPTAQASPAYALQIQFWTSRGFAVVDVNYGGSSGYGRAYRQTLNGNWGVVDVEDVIAAARYLALTGRSDPARTAISGGSAGGYTVLVALSSSDVFRAGADYYGISDMTALVRDTHKFESRYLDSLIGPLPQAKSTYDSRSPLNHLDGFKVPLIVFQGADDPVVPPNQSAMIVDALRARGVPLAYLVYPGESHGFRKPENIVHSLQSELSFYGQVFGFAPADALPPLTIERLPPSS
ncbi:MAG: peptidase prolyl oligopeptidase active site domain protein [Gammaproteobacteria bacterium]|nr:peptidase prolyl oligopeptidase active site domain protein [Gammaproteobacteria bacterium]